MRYKLLVPMKRSPHPPEYTARGVGIGIFWALTPLIPGQMYLVFMTWLALRWSKRTDFNVLIALAWVWTTNVFTMGPVYYTFYVTGEILLGRWSGMTGYSDFAGEWEAAFAAAAHSDVFIFLDILTCAPYLRPTLEAGNYKLPAENNQ